LAPDSLQLELCQSQKISFHESNQRRSGWFSYPSISAQLRAVGVVVEVVLQIYLIGDLRLCHLYAALKPGEELVVVLVRPVNLGEPCVLDDPPPPLLELDEVHVSLDEAQSPHHPANIQRLHDVDGVEVDVAVEEVVTLCHPGLSLGALGQVRTPGD